MQELDELNEYLSRVKLIKPNSIIKRNICFIVGLPRCGSTLLQQVIISRYKVGYISNIVGKFWKNPVAGCILHKSLDDENYHSNFSSDYGNTKGPFEPCEFGWFWRRVLDIDSDSEMIGSDIDWEYINKTLKGMSYIFEQPLIFDTPLVCSNILKIANNIKGFKVIYLRRDSRSVCNSILSARLKRFGDINKYYGSKSKSWHEISKIEDPVFQVINQVYDLKNEIETDLNSLPTENVFNLDISSLRDKPIEVADRIADFIGIEGIPKNINYPTFANRDNVSFFDKRFENQFKEAWDIIFENKFKN